MNSSSQVDTHRDHIRPSKQHSVAGAGATVTEQIADEPGSEALQRVRTASIPPRPSDILALQRALGNKATMDLCSARAQQTPATRPHRQSAATAVMQRQQENAPALNGRDAARDAGAGAGGVAQFEASLRTLYQRADEAVYREAQFMRSRGVPEEQVAQWVVEARNQAKERIRQWDLDVVRLLAERRNMQKYGHPVGLSYEQYRRGDPARSRAPRTNQEIIEGSRNTNRKADRWAGRLRIAGRILIAIDIGVSGWRVATAPEVDRPRVLIEETGGLAGAVAGGWAGAKGGGMVGGRLGGLPGAAVGALVGGIGGAIAGGLEGRRGGRFIANQLYPPAQTAFEGGFR